MNLKNSPSPNRPNSDQVISRLQTRHRAMRATREYFNANDFLEVDAPCLISANCVEAHIDPISVTVRGNDLSPARDLYLHTSPEAYLKRLLSHGAQRIFQLGHVFRDGEWGRIHAPEFMMLEWYRVGSGLNDLIVDCENLFGQINVAVGGKSDLSEPFERCHMSDLWEQYARIDLTKAIAQIANGEVDALALSAQKAGYSLRPNANFDDVFHHVMSVAIEPQIGLRIPCVIDRWPAQMAGLARRCEDDLLYADRFEIYWKQMELANAFAELVDPVEQKSRFESDLALRSQLKKVSLPISVEFLQDLVFMPPSSGIAVGFDRLLAVIASTDQIGNVQPLSWL